MRILNPDHIAELLNLINDGPYFRLLGMKVVELAPSYSKVELDLDQKHLNPFGAVHGGVYSSLIDTAAYWAAYCELDEGVGCTSLDVSVSNLAMAKAGKLIACGASIKIGRSICLCEATVKDSGGIALAHGTSKLMILDGKQSINQAIEAMGHPMLPPKFITQTMSAQA